MTTDDKRRSETGWERDLVQRLATAALTEQRRARRWGLFFKILLFGYLFTLLWLAWPGGGDLGRIAHHGEHTAVVELNGLIADTTKANAESVMEGLREAFAAKGVQGVVLRINSPGGSPVQSAWIYDEVRRLRQQHPDIPLHAVIVDVGASGGYYVAAAADNIYASPASVVGSIGVLMNGFGFVGTMEKLGVERRLLTAGANKGMLDPFSPNDRQAQAHLQQLLEQIHQQFVTAVQTGRGARLVDDPTLFSGLVWSGEQARQLGLIDDFGDVDRVAREVIGAEEVVNYSVKPDLLHRFADRIGAVLATMGWQQQWLQLAGMALPQLQ